MAGANAIRIVYTYYGAAIIYVEEDPIHPLYVSMSSSYTILTITCLLSTINIVRKFTSKTLAKSFGKISKI